VRRLILLISVVVLVTILDKVPMSVMSDSSVSFTDINTPDKEITASQTQASNF
jgi:peptidoglycan hydrolase CwlO-like protein